MLRHVLVFFFLFISIENSWQWNHSSVPHYTVYHRGLWSVHFRVSPELIADKFHTVDRIFTRDWPFSSNGHQDLRALSFRYIV